MIKCPKCNNQTYFQEISSGGDGLLFCTRCEWVEDPTKDEELNNDN